MNEYTFRAARVSKRSTAPSRSRLGNGKPVHQRRERGFAMFMVLTVLILLGVLITMTTTLLRPAGSMLDAYTSLAQAQALADGALQEALARLDAGETPSFADERMVNKGLAGKVAVTSKSSPAGKECLELEAVAQVPQAGDSTKTTRLSLRATAAKTARGTWRIKEYLVKF